MAAEASAAARNAARMIEDMFRHGRVLLKTEQIASRAGIDEQTARRILVGLQRRGFVHCDEHQHWTQGRRRDRQAAKDVATTHATALALVAAIPAG